MLCCFSRLLISLGNGEPWPFIVPGHRAYFPARIGQDELCGDHAPAFKCAPAVAAIFGIGAETVGHVTKDFGNRCRFHFSEAR